MAPCRPSTNGLVIQGISVLTCNIRSLREKLDEISVMAHDLHPQLMAFTETWLHPSIFDAEVQILGYNFFRSDRIQNRCSGGVILYYLLGLDVQFIEAYSDNEGTQEGLICRVKCGPKTSVVVLVYRSPISDSLLTLEKIEHWR